MSQKNNILGDLTNEQVRALRDATPQSRDELCQWLKVFLDQYLFDTVIEEGNSTPMDFVWDVYSKTVLNRPGDGRYKILGMASRDSLKTRGCACLEFVDLLYDKLRDTVHMASIEAQGNVCYKYVQKFSQLPYFHKGRILSTIKAETKSDNGTTLIVTTGTMNATNAHHGGLLILDEVDLLPKGIFDEAHGMLSSTLLARGVAVYISSRKHAFGNIENLLRLAAVPESGIKVHKWGILEQSASCPDSRSGTDKATYYVDEDQLIALDEEEYKQSYNKNAFFPAEGYSGCKKCGIFSFCKGRLKKQKSFNPYYMPIDVVVNRFKSEDVEFFKEQRLNRKPSKEGLCFPTYDEMRNLKTYNEMWKIFTGEDNPNPDIRATDLINKFLECGCRLVLGIDWGFTDPFVALLIALDGQDRGYVLDYIETTGHSDLECVTLTANRWGNLPIGIYPDTENPSGIKELKNIINSKQLKWYIAGTVIKDIDLGYGILRNFLRTPGTIDTRLYIHHSIGLLKSELKTHHYEIRKSDGQVLDRPEDKNNHGIDSLRYPLATIFQRGHFSFSSNIPAKDVPLVDDVTPQAVLKTVGVAINESLTEDDIKEIEKNNKDKGFKGGGGGGFSWSF